VNRTLQDRLVNELRVAGMRTLARANRYLEERFLPQYNAELARPPADPAVAFVTAGGAPSSRPCVTRRHIRSLRTTRWCWKGCACGSPSNPAAEPVQG